jgi:hypothetical protein
MTNHNSLDEVLREIEALGVQEGVLEKQLEDVIHEIRELRASQAKLQHGVVCGSIVSSRGKTYKVSMIDMGISFDGKRKPWLRGFVQKKDGTFGKVERCIFNDWVMVK